MCIIIKVSLQCSELFGVSFYKRFGASFLVSTVNSKHGAIDPWQSADCDDRSLCRDACHSLSSCDCFHQTPSFSVSPYFRSAFTLFSLEDKGHNL